VNDRMMMVAGHAFTPLEVFGALITFAVVTAAGGLAFLVAGHEKPTKSVD
jgi:hypothetical protein